MNSKRRTQILYDDPNSMFKSGKKIYLHELQGATLKTSKPFPEDIRVGVKAADLFSSLISNLSQLQNIVEYFYTGLFERILVDNSFSKISLRSANKLILNIEQLLSKLSKFPPSVFNEDDIFSLMSFYRDIITKLQEMSEYESDVNEIFIDEWFKSSEFKVFFTKMTKLFPKIHTFINLVNISGLTGTNKEANIPSLVPNDLPGYIDVIPPPEDLVDLEPAPPLEGAGRFNKVLSSRIRKQQQHNFKRFL
jgi:hypothetical protein